MVCYQAAASGHLDVLKWLRSQEPPCPFPEGREAEELVASTAQQGHFHVLEWIIASEPCNMRQAAWHAATSNCSRTFAILAAHHFLDDAPMDELLASAAGRGSLQIAKYFTPYLQRHDSSNAMFMALASAIGETSARMTKPSLLEVIKWLWSHLNSFSPDHQKTLTSIVTHNKSPVPLELAACGCAPIIPWTSDAFRIAICEGNKKLLWWLLHECEYAHSREVPIGCGPGRTLLLAHGHGWSIRSRSQILSDLDLGHFDLSHLDHLGLGHPGLAHAERLFSAFYGAAHSHRLLQPSCANLGSLPDVLLKKIACTADIDFSWTFTSS